MTQSIANSLITYVKAIRRSLPWEISLSPMMFDRFHQSCLFSLTTGIGGNCHFLTTYEYWCIVSSCHSPSWKWIFLFTSYFLGCSLVSRLAGATVQCQFIVGRTRRLSAPLLLVVFLTCTWTLASSLPAVVDKNCKALILLLSTTTVSFWWLLLIQCFPFLDIFWLFRSFSDAGNFVIVSRCSYWISFVSFLGFWDIQFLILLLLCLDELLLLFDLIVRCNFRLLRIVLWVILSWVFVRYFGRVLPFFLMRLCRSFGFWCWCLLQIIVESAFGNLILLIGCVSCYIPFFFCI